MRLFIAIDLPDSVKEHLRTIQEKFRDAGKISFTHDFHMTLKFLGECNEKRKEKVERELDGIPFMPFESELLPLGTFGGSHPRVLFVDMKVPPWLTSTVEEIKKKMEKCGFPKEHRFTPHITLARVRFLKNPKQFLEMLKNTSVEPLHFHVSSFFLFESRLSPKGATHVKLKEFPSVSS